MRGSRRVRGDPAPPSSAPPPLPVCAPSSRVPAPPLHAPNPSGPLGRQTPTSHHSGLGLSWRVSVKDSNSLRPTRTSVHPSRPILAQRDTAQVGTISPTLRSGPLRCHLCDSGSLPLTERPHWVGHPPLRPSSRFEGCGKGRESRLRRVSPPFSSFLGRKPPTSI